MLTLSSARMCRRCLFDVPVWLGRTSGPVGARSPTSGVQAGCPRRTGVMPWGGLLCRKCARSSGGLTWSGRRRQGCRGGGYSSGGSLCGGGRQYYRLHRGPAVRHGVYVVRIGLVDSEPMFQAALDDEVHSPELVQVGKPLGGVFVGPLVAGEAEVRFRGSDANSLLIVRLVVRGSISWGVQIWFSKRKALFVEVPVVSSGRVWLMCDPFVGLLFGRGAPDWLGLLVVRVLVPVPAIWLLECQDGAAY